MSNYPDDIDYNCQSGNSPFAEPKICHCCSNEVDDYELEHCDKCIELIEAGKL